MNCKADFFLTQDGIYGTLENGSFTGFFAEIVSRRAEVVTGAVVLTYHRSLVKPFQDIHHVCMKHLCVNF